MDKICVILGAGASHDVYNGSSQLYDAKWKPPLARDLFDLENHTVYGNVLANYPGAELISENLASLRGGDDFNLEEQLLGLAKNPNKRLREAYAHVPPYLRDLIYRSARHYMQGTGCYGALVTKLLGPARHEILFLTLNYDDLLERALGTYSSVEYPFDPFNLTKSVADYVQKGRQANVVKLHGSINWFVLFPRNLQQRWVDLVKSRDLLAKPSEAEMVVKEIPSDLRSATDNDQWLYPVLTAPLAGKNLKDAVCPARHMDAARDFLKDCRKFLIIGTSGLDEDLLALLDDSIDATEVPWIHFVGAGNQTDGAPSRFRQGVTAFTNFHVQPPTRQSFNKGLRAYLSSGEITSLLASSI